MSGATISNVTVKPQLERGTSATTFIKGNAAGQVWVEEKSTSPTELNSLRSNAIMNQPYQIKQYVNGAWTTKTGRLYKTQTSYLTFGPYEHLEYIQTTGTQYIDTDITVFNQSAFKIESTVAFTAVDYNYNHLWSNRAADEKYQMYANSSKKLRYKWGSTTAKEGSTTLNTSKHVYTFNKDGSNQQMLIDTTQVASGTNSSTINSTLRLFTNPEKAYFSKAKIYEIKIYVSGTLRYHLVPARRISDNVIGLKDILNNKFYKNTGTGTFGTGYIKAFLD